MPFATPLALLGLLFVPAVVAMYLLKLRRDEAVVPSTLLWNRLVADVEANAPWQRLRRSLLLLLQLLPVVAPNRLAAAKQAALDALRDLPAGGKVSVVSAGRTARVVAAGSTDMGRI